MLTESHTVDLEELAAYIDGRLSKDRRARVEERLLSDEDFYEVFLETVRFQQEDAQRDDAFDVALEFAGPGERSDRQEDSAKIAGLGRPTRRAPERKLLVRPRQSVRRSGSDDVDRFRLWAEGRLQQFRHRVRRAASSITIGRSGVLGASAALSLAAVALVVVFLRSSEDLLANLKAQEIVLSPDWEDPGWARLRGSGLEDDFSPSKETIFRLGVRAIDLNIALRADERETAQRLAAELGSLTDVPSLLLQQMSLAEFADQVEQTEIDDLLNQAGTLENSLEEALGDQESREYFALGKWAEAGRLAALSRDESAVARTLRQMPDLDSIDLSERAQRDLAQHVVTLEEYRGQRDLAADQLEKSDEAFRGIIRALAGVR